MCITFIFFGSVNIHDLIYYYVVEGSDGQIVCVANFTQSLSVYNRATLLANYILPFVIQVVSITILIILTARSRSRISNNNKKTFLEVLQGQFTDQKELYITPLIIILSSLPQTIFSFIFSCTELSVWQRHVLLISYFFVLCTTIARLCTFRVAIIKLFQRISRNTVRQTIYFEMVNVTKIIC